jgi:hypothetical protein
VKGRRSRECFVPYIFGRGAASDLADKAQTEDKDHSSDSMQWLLDIATLRHELTPTSKVLNLLTVALLRCSSRLRCHCESLGMAQEPLRMACSGKRVSTAFCPSRVATKKYARIRAAVIFVSHKSTLPLRNLGHRMA